MTTIVDDYPDTQHYAPGYNCSLLFPCEHPHDSGKTCFCCGFAGMQCAPSFEKADV